MLHQPIKIGSEFVFEDQDILTEMEKYHVDKLGSQPLKITQTLQEWIEKARKSADNDIMDSPISRFEIESTYNTCSGAPGADRFLPKLIDNAEREAMTNCLEILWQKAWSKGVFIKEWKQEHRAVLSKPNKES